MSYMSMTIYNIHSFLFIIVYIVCIIFICLYCMLVLAKALRGNNSCKLVVHVREKGRDLTQSYDKSPYTNRNVKRAK